MRAFLVPVELTVLQASGGRFAVVVAVSGVIVVTGSASVRGGRVVARRCAHVHGAFDDLFECVGEFLVIVDSLVDHVANDRVEDRAAENQLIHVAQRLVHQPRHERRFDF